MAGEELEHFKTQVEPHLERLFRTAARLTRNRADAEDLVQETCLKAWEKPPALRESVSLQSWLLRILYNRFIDETRRRQSAPVRPFDGDSDASDAVASAEPGPTDIAQHDETLRQLDAAWPRLDASQRVLLALRAEGYELSEIADITGIAHEVLRARLHRARRSLARFFREAGIGETTPSRIGSIR